MVHFSASPKNEPHSPSLRERSEGIILNHLKNIISFIQKKTPLIYIISLSLGDKLLLL
ncbi:MAG: hypothetical protein U5L45_05650 [Saprospiraceae bacterium]|nr:hypothetical protein [Saprospiraceae bacterium]